MQQLKTVPTVKRSLTVGVCGGGGGLPSPKVACCLESGGICEYISEATSRFDRPAVIQEFRTVS